MSSWRIDPFIIRQCSSLSLITFLFWYLLSEINITTLVSFDQCSHSIFFSMQVLLIYMFLCLKWVSCRNIQLTYFLIHSQNFCLWIGVFRPLIFKVINDIAWLISTTFVTIFYLFPYSFIISIFHSFSVFCSFNEAFYIVRGILAGVVPIEDIIHRDTESYFGILYKNNNRKIPAFP